MFGGSGTFEMWTLSGQSYSGALSSAVARLSPVAPVNLRVL
jgi:hypothetical protein